MPVQRFIFFVIVVATVVVLTFLLATVLLPGGLTVVKALLLLCFLGVAPWLGICMANAVPGFLPAILGEIRLDRFIHQAARIFWRKIARYSVPCVESSCKPIPRRFSLGTPLSDNCCKTRRFDAVPQLSDRCQRHLRASLVGLKSDLIQYGTATPSLFAQ